MKKRILSLLLVGTMTLSLLTGCGYGGKETKAIINLDNLKKADEQIEAITQADTREQYAGDIHDILRSYPLVTLTKMACLAAQYLD